MKKYFNFNPGNYNITKEQLKNVESLIYVEDNNIIQEYHKQFIKIIGTGYGISFSAGRMAVYVLLKVLNIGSGDEVLVVGFTCSVMINAILRIGATPVYTDVSTRTFGTDPENVRRKITGKTKIIIAQHSFGIPCEIEEIVKIGKEKNIFVLEDCALAFGSSINGVPLGNFGDAAIFSTDHTKPLNTLIGGFFYTKDEKLFNVVKNSFESAKELSLKHKKNVYKQLFFEKKWFDPKKYKYFKYINFPIRVKRKIFGGKLLFMVGDYGPPDLIKPKYPYPSKFPAFLAQVGIYELEYFEKEKNRRISILKRYLEIFSKSIYKEDIPSIYYDKDMEIVPLRFVFFSERSHELIERLSGFIDFSQIWFKQPVIATRFDLKYLKYQQGDCPNSEHIGKKIINFPCVIPEKFEDYFFRTLEKKLNKTT